MNNSQQTLSDVVIHSKYARHVAAKGRRETWEEIVDRYLTMMLGKYGKEGDLLNWSYYKDKSKDSTWTKFLSPMGREILTNGQYLYSKAVLPSMRAAQFAGEAVSKNQARLYNCSFLPIDHPASFSETMFLLLGGTGVGYSVQTHHIAQLPPVFKAQGKATKFLVGDSIEGWADAVKALVYYYLGKRKHKPRFDFSDIRAKGSRLVTAGGKAPGPAPLRTCLAKMEGILEVKQDGEHLTSLECHDLLCLIADAVLAGGIRRAAMIALFSPQDQPMLTCKDGNWWELNPQRGRSNNSAVLLRSETTQDQFQDLWKKISASYSGEPGIYFTNDLDLGTNPCCEISLQPYQFCNLTEVNAGNIVESVKYACRRTENTKVLPNWLPQHFYQQELTNRVRVATFFGTLQAGFTDFHYLRPIWKETTEEDALIGVGITGICSGDILDLNLQEASQVVVKENKRVAALIGINAAARTTCIKPSGTTSCVIGSSSGIHAWHSKYYIRNIQCKVGDDLYTYFHTHHPGLVKVMDLDPNSAVIGIPQMAPEGAVLRENENALQMLDRVFQFYSQWVKPGHQSGNNTNNVSATVSVDPNRDYPRFGEMLDQGLNRIGEWELVGETLWNNRHQFNGMSVLPEDGGNYKDAPFQVCTKEEYEDRFALCEGIDLTLILEEDDNTTLAESVACAGGACAT